MILLIGISFEKKILLLTSRYFEFIILVTIWGYTSIGDCGIKPTIIIIIVTIIIIIMPMVMIIITIITMILKLIIIAKCTTNE